MTIANARDSLGKVIEIIGIGDEDLKNFVENRERLLQISFNKMNFRFFLNPSKIVLN